MLNTCVLYQHALATQRQSTVLRANLWILVVAIIAMDANKPRLPPAQRGHKRKLAPSILPRSKRCPSASGTAITPSPLAYGWIGVPATLERAPPTTQVLISILASDVRLALRALRDYCNAFNI